MKSIQNQIKPLIKLIFFQLSQKDYEKTVELLNGTRLSPNDIQKIIESYGRTIEVPPEQHYENLDIVEVDDSSPKRWSVVQPFWTKEEGYSDLSLEVTAIQEADGICLHLDDIHVL